MLNKVEVLNGQLPTCARVYTLFRRLAGTVRLEETSRPARCPVLRVDLSRAMCAMLVAESRYISVPGFYMLTLEAVMTEKGVELGKLNRLPGKTDPH